MTTKTILRCTPWIKLIEYVHLVIVSVRMSFREELITASEKDIYSDRQLLKEAASALPALMS